MYLGSSVGSTSVNFPGGNNVHHYVISCYVWVLTIILFSWIFAELFFSFLMFK